MFLKARFIKTIYILLIGFSVIAAAYFSFKAARYYLEIQRKQSQLEKRRIELEKRKVAWDVLEDEIKKELNGFAGEAAIVIKDLNTGWQIRINQDKLFASASLVKIPIMAACFYAANEGRIKLQDILTLKAAHKVSGTGILKDAPVGAEFTIEELIQLMISESDNTAANMLIECLGFDYLNNCFKKLGLKDTNISRAMMDFISRGKGRENFTSASDLAFLLDEIYNTGLINRAYSQMCLELLKKQKIKDRIPVKLPAHIPVAHKTGLEKGICHDAGIVFTSQGDFLICVLTKHKDKTARPAKRFIAQVAYLAYNYYQNL